MLLLPLQRFCTNTVLGLCTVSVHTHAEVNATQRLIKAKQRKMLLCFDKPLNVAAAESPSWHQSRYADAYLWTLVLSVIPNLSWVTHSFSSGGINKAHRSSTAWCNGREKFLFPIESQPPKKSYTYLFAHVSVLTSSTGSNIFHQNWNPEK